jgi:O-antigen/teichoic acid export membrane protein
MTPNRGSTAAVAVTESGGMSRSSRFLNGVRWTLVTNIAGSGFAFLSGILLARILDPTGYGRYRTIIYLVGFCAAVAGFELRDALRRFIPACKVEDPGRIVATVLAACAVVGGFSILITAVLTAFTSRIAAGIYKQPSLAGMLRWTGILVTATAAAALMEAALTGLELYKAATARSLIAQTMALPLQLLLAWRFGVTGAIWGYGILLGSRATLMGLAVADACRASSWSAVGIRDVIAMARRLMGFSLPLLITALLIPFANWWLSASLARTSGIVEVGIFAVAYALIQLLTTIVLAAGVPLMPVLAEASTSGDIRTLARIVSRGAVTIILLLFIPAFVLGANAHAVIVLLYGRRYSAAAPVLFQFALACLPLGINESLNRSSVATGHVRLAVGGHLIWLGAIVAAVEFYGRLHGAVGCAQSFLAAELMQSIYLAAVFHLYLRFDMRGIAKIFAICSAAMVPAYFLSSVTRVWSLAAFLATSVAVCSALWHWSLGEADRTIVCGWLDGIGLRRLFPRARQI